MSHASARDVASKRARWAARRIAKVALLAAILFGLDHGIAWLAVQTNAAGALLSPGGGVPLAAFVVALSFAMTRLALVLTVGLGAALTGSEVVRSVWNAVALRLSSRTPERPVLVGRE